jgi:hypothetical protein
MCMKQQWQLNTYFMRSQFHFSIPQSSGLSEAGYMRVDIPPKLFHIFIFQIYLKSLSIIQGHMLTHS